MGDLFFRISVKGANELAAKLGEPIDPKIQGPFKTFAHAVKRNVQKVTPKKTGALSRSIAARQQSANTWVIQEGKFYGEFVRHGARGGKGGSGYIFPVRKKALYWQGLDHPIPFVGPPMTSLHPGIRYPERTTEYDVLGLAASYPEQLAFIKKLGDSILKISSGFSNLGGI